MWKWDQGRAIPRKGIHNWVFPCSVWLAEEVLHLRAAGSRIRAEAAEGGALGHAHKRFSLSLPLQAAGHAHQSLPLQQVVVLRLQVPHPGSLLL